MSVKLRVGVKEWLTKGRMDLGAMAVCTDWENVNGLNPLLHEPSEPSEPPVVKTSPERLTRALHPAPIEDAYHGAVFGNLGIALPCADRRLRHRPFARTGQAKTPRQQAVVCPECKMVAVPIQGRQVATQKLHFKEKPFKCEGASVTTQLPFTSQRYVFSGRPATGDNRSNRR